MKKVMSIFSCAALVGLLVAPVLYYVDWISLLTVSSLMFLFFWIWMSCFTSWLVMELERS